MHVKWTTKTFLFFTALKYAILRLVGKLASLASLDSTITKFVFIRQEIKVVFVAID